MADSINQVLLVGNAGADPELRYTQGGKAVMNIRLATESTYQDASGVEQKRSEWHDVVVWGGLAEALADSARKGSRMIVIGETRTRSYDKDGAKHYRTEVHASNVGLVPFKQQSGQRDSRQQQRQDPPREQNRRPAAPRDDAPF